MSESKKHRYARQSSDGPSDQRLDDMYRAAQLYYEKRKLVGRRCAECKFEFTHDRDVEPMCPKCFSKSIDDMMDRYTQEDIAKIMSTPDRDISRTEVQRLLHDAEENEVIYFTVVRPPTRSTDFTDLAEKVRMKFGLKKVLLVPGQPDLYAGELPELAQEAIRILAAKRAARELQETISNNDVLALAFGFMVNTILRLLQPTTPMPNLTIVPMLGVLNPRPTGYPFEANMAVEIAGEAFGSRKSFWLPAPAFIREPRHREIVSSLPIVNDVLGRLLNSTYVVTSLAPLSLGNEANDRNNRKPYAPVYVEQGLITQKEIDALSKKGAIADISGLWFDIRGNVVRDENLQAIGLDIDTLKDLVRKKQVVMAVVAGQRSRLVPLLAALRGRCINTLVTDSVSAELLCEMSERI